MKYGLGEPVIKKICAVFARFPAIEKAVLYGSRAKGNYKDGSDIDLTLYGDALTAQDLANIADALDELLLPYMFDLSLYADLDHAKLRDHIERVGVVFYARKDAVKNKWSIKKMTEVAAIVNGGTPKTDVDEFWNGSHQWITPAEMGKRKSPYVDSTARTLSDSGLQSSANLIPANSVIMSSRAPIGHLVINTVPMAFNQGCKGLVPKANELNYKYLYYFLLHNVEYLNSLGTGATFKELSSGKLKDVDIPVPSLNLQKRIVAILDAAFEGIDKAIANTEKNLASTRELFEDYLNSLNFDKRELGGFVSIKTGKLDSNEAVEGGRYPFFTCSREVFAIDSYAFDCEAILLAGNNASGDFNVKHYNGRFNAYQRTYVININDTNELRYRFLYFQLLKSLKDLKRGSVGAGTKFLKIGMIKELKILAPSIEMQDKILEKLEGILSSSSALEKIYKKKLAYLNELKQSLFQKAFSGELTADAIEEAA
jgi:type I restriction enzyme S subunit